MLVTLLAHLLTELAIDREFSQTEMHQFVFKQLQMALKNDISTK